MGVLGMSQLIVPAHQQRMAGRRRSGTFGGGGAARKQTAGARGRRAPAALPRGGREGWGVETAGNERCMHGDAAQQVELGCSGMDAVAGSAKQVGASGVCACRGVCVASDTVLE